jgi:hypothetical protein
MLEPLLLNTRVSKGTPSIDLRSACPLVPSPLRRFDSRRCEDDLVDFHVVEFVILESSCQYAGGL